MVTVTANESSAIDLTFEFLSYGWTISGKKAIHEACNSGPILTTKIKFVVGKSYEIGFIVSGYVSGNVYPVLGNTTGTAVMANGTFKQVLLCTVNDKLQFISNGNLVIEYLEAIPQDGLLVDNGATIEFNEEENKITSYFSYRPEMFAKISNKMVAFKDGGLWIQEANETRNNFFGQQYTSRITFIVNIEPNIVKRLYTIIQRSNHIWYIPELIVKSIDGKPNGMKSRILKGNFKNIKGVWFANFLRNLLDPRFNTQTEAILRGEKLDGQMFEITLENDNTTEVSLLNVEIIVSKSTFTK